LDHGEYRSKAEKAIYEHCLLSLPTIGGKHIKAILVLKGSPFPKTHDLTALSKMCEEIGILIGVDEDNLDILSGYAVATRYPGAEPPLDDAREALQTTKAIRRFVRSFLGLKK
jgi:HEPN domain-containing protein